MTDAHATRIAPRLLTALAALATAAVVYGSWIPFDFEWGTWDLLQERFAQFKGARLGFADGVTNVIVYIPVALFIGLRGAWFGVPAARRSIMALAVSAVAIVLSEGGQLLLASRHASVMDVVCNLGGVMIGIVLVAPVWRVGRIAVRFLRIQLASSPFHAAFWIVVSCIALAKLAPFDLAVQSETFMRSLAEARWIPTAPLQSSASQTLVDDLIDVAGSFFVFVLAGLLGAMALRQQGEPKAWSAGVIAAKLGFIGVGIELLQLLINSHTCDVADAMTYFGGAMVGAYLGATVIHQMWHERGLSRQDNPAAKMLLTIAMVVQVTLIAVGAMPEDGRWVAPSDDSIQWIPFYAQFQKPFALAVGQIVSSGLWYLTLAGLAAAMLPRRNGFYTLAMCSFLTVGVVSLTEGVQAFTTTSVADVTEPLIALAAAVVAAVVWRWVHRVRAGSIQA
jgi:VanZ family protein